MAKAPSERAHGLRRMGGKEKRDSFSHPHRATRLTPVMIPLSHLLQGSDGSIHAHYAPSHLMRLFQVAQLGPLSHKQRSSRARKTNRVRSCKERKSRGRMPCHRRMRLLWRAGHSTPEGSNWARFCCQILQADKTGPKKGPSNADPC